MKNLFLIFALLFSSVSHAQNSVLENPIPVVGQVVQDEKEIGRDGSESVIEIMSGDSPIGRGVLVSVSGNDGLIATAYHVTFPGDAVFPVNDSKSVIYHAPQHHNLYKIRFRNGKISENATFSHGNKANDWAVLKVTVPSEVVVATVGTFQTSNKLFTFDRDWKRKSLPFKHQVDNGMAILSDQVAVTGESGGPVFNEKLEVVGTVCGGWYWLDDQTAKDRFTTWPHKTAVFKAEFLRNSK